MDTHEKERQRYFIELAYNGSDYHGWQIQPNATSVQEVLENAFSTLLREKIQVIGAGRTDTGVHASYFVAHFDTRESFKPDALLFKLNRFLPKNIAIYSIVPVNDSAHARFSATNRTYYYTILQRKDPFRQDLGYTFTRTLDVEAMQKASNILFQYTDFTSFSRLHTDVKTNNCEIRQAQWFRSGSELTFVIAADRFLRNMVRAIVGTILEIGQGKRSVASMHKLIEAKDRKLAGASAPASGLFLTNIEYPDELFCSKLDKAFIQPSKIHPFK